MTTNIISPKKFDHKQRSLIVPSIPKPTNNLYVSDNTYKKNNIKLLPVIEPIKTDYEIVIEDDKKDNLLEELKIFKETQKLILKKLGLEEEAKPKKQDLEKLPEEEKKKLRLEFIEKIIKNGGKNQSIPYEDTSLNYLSEIASTYEKLNKEKNNKMKIKIGLDFFFYIINFLSEKFKYEKATKLITFLKNKHNIYENFIDEFCNKYVSKETGDFNFKITLGPVQKVIILTFIQIIIFIITEKFDNPTVKNFLNKIEGFITSALNDENNSEQEQEESSFNFSSIFNLFSSTPTPYDNKTPVMKPNPSPLEVKRESPKKRSN